MLYKYKEINEYTIDALKKDKIWYSQPSCFNDVFDTDILIRHCKSKHPFEQVITARDNGVISANEFMNIMTALDGNSAILCLCEDPKNNAMWSYYGKNHRGFCMEFEFDEKNEENIDCIINRNIGICCLKVNYMNSYIDVDDILFNPVKKGNLFLQKSAEWMHEKEYRVIFQMGNKKNVLGTLNNWMSECDNHNSDANYLKLKNKIKDILQLFYHNYFSDCIDEAMQHILEIEKEYVLNEVDLGVIEHLKRELNKQGELNIYPGRLSSIIFGIRTSEKDMKEIIDASKHTTNIKYKKVFPSETDYKLYIKDVPPCYLD